MDTLNEWADIIETYRVKGESLTATLYRIIGEWQANKQEYDEIAAEVKRLQNRNAELRQTIDVYAESCIDEPRPEDKTETYARELFDRDSRLMDTDAALRCALEFQTALSRLILNNSYGKERG